MKGLKFLIILQCVASMTAVSLPMTAFKKTSSSRYSPAVSTIPVRSSEDCLYACANSNNCKYVNYHEETMSCEFCTEQNSGAILSASDWVVFSQVIGQSNPVSSSTPSNPISTSTPGSPISSSIPGSPISSSIPGTTSQPGGTCVVGWMLGGNYCYQLVKDTKIWIAAESYRNVQLITGRGRPQMPSVHFSVLPLYNGPPNNDSLLTTTLATVFRTTGIQIRFGCQGLQSGAHLASIKTQAKLDFLRVAYQSEITGDVMWVGAERNETTGDFVWTDQTPVSLDIGWQENQPDNDGGFQNCVQIVGDDFKFNDFQCYNNFWSLCEYELN